VKAEVAFIYSLFNNHALIIFSQKYKLLHTCCSHIMVALFVPSNFSCAINMYISNWKTTNVRTCQNISRTPNTPWSPGG